MIWIVSSVAKRIVALGFALLPYNLSGQSPAVENSLFWEITGNDLPAPSYLYGTFHLLDRRYVDTLANVQDKFRQSQKFVSEIDYDSTLMFKLVTKAMMPDSTLDQLLPPEWYDKTEDWIKELSSYNLSSLSRMNPISIQMLITNLLQVQLYSTAEKPMDLYLEDLAKNQGKETAGLESIDDQLQALYHFSYKRQAELLIQFVSKKDSAAEDLIRLNKLYRNQDLSGLQELSDMAYTTDEMSVMLDQRNGKWMQKIPSMIQENSCFIAVGALHLAGENGLVNLLRKTGYSVIPIPLN